MTTDIPAASPPSRDASSRDHPPLYYSAELADLLEAVAAGEVSVEAMPGSVRLAPLDQPPATAE